MRHLCLALLLASAGPLARAGYTPANSPWNRPSEPFTIAGNLHYVGASGVSAFLISTPAGHILIDCGFRETVAQIEASLEKLGFDLADIRVLLISHAHYDHIGGMAELKARTGARLLAHPAEFAAMERGGAGDFAFGDTFLFPPVIADAPLHDGEEIVLGGTVLTAHFTPGHTRGNTTWTLTVQDGNQPRHVVIAASLTAPGYRLADNEAYPGIMADFERSIVKLRGLPCDILLSGHSWDFGLHEKRAALATAAPGVNPFVDPQTRARLVDQAERTLREQIAQQRAAAAATPPPPESAARPQA